MPAAIFDPIYQRTAIKVLSFLFASGILMYILRKKNPYFVRAWASIKSWLVAAPVLFLLLGTPEPWPLVVLTALAITGAKIFFQMMGMFHRSYFVFSTYLCIIALSVCIYYRRLELYNLMPMVLLAICCIIPFIRNNYKKMIQYISLTQLSFIFLGWSFMHLGLIMQLEKGIYQLLYLIFLTEFCDNTNMALGKFIGKKGFIENINTTRTIESTTVSIALTLVLAFVMRYLLPDNSEKYWLASGLIASFAGLAGDMIMTVVRKDLGIRDLGEFIIGRGDFLQRMDRLIFVAPVYYYVMYYFL